MKKFIAVIVLVLMPLVASAGLDLDVQGMQIWVDTARSTNASDVWTYTAKNQTGVTACVTMRMTNWNNVGWKFLNIKLAPGQSAYLGKVWQGNYQQSYTFNYEALWTEQGSSQCI